MWLFRVFWGLRITHGRRGNQVVVPRRGDGCSSGYKRINLWHRGTGARLLQKRGRHLSGTCINQNLIRLAKEYFVNIILSIFPPASPGVWL